MILDRQDPVAESYLAQRGVNEALPTFSERVANTFRFDAESDSILSRQIGISNVFDDIIQTINRDVGPIRSMEIGGERAPMGLNINPGMFLNEVSLLGTLGEREYRYAAEDLFQTVTQYEASNPGSIPQEILDLMSLDAIEQRVRDNAGEIRREREEMARLPGGAIADFVGGFGAGMLEVSEDPVQALSMFVGGAGARSLYSLAFREAVIGGAFEAARQPGLADWYDNLGLDYTSEDFFRNVGFGAAAGAGFAVAGDVLARGIQRLGGVARLPTARAAGGVAEGGIPVPAAAPAEDFLASLTTSQIREGLDILQQSGVQLSSEGQAAFTLAQRLEEAETLNPGLPPAEHARNLHMMDLFMAEGRFPPDYLAAPQEAVSRVALDAAQPDLNNLDGVIYSFDPREIGVDAATFQFKSGGDQYGVTDRFSADEVFDPELAGTITVYEYADGRRYIADGHQRLGLAMRYLASNPDADIRMYGVLWREVDGITPREAMVQAAITNLATFEPGTIPTPGRLMDAAKVARADPARFEASIGAKLNATSIIVRVAREMQDLTDDAFGAVINEVISPQFGAIIGRILRDKPDLQMAAIGVLAKTQPGNAFQAEAIVRQIRESDFEVETQTSLFGDELVVESLFADRARVLDQAVRSLRQDRAAFASLTRNAETIEAAGNVLDEATNQRRADLSAQAISLVQALANRKGALSEALSAAARSARESGNYTAGARQFTDAIRTAIADGDFERLTSSEIGRPGQDTLPSRADQIAEEPSLAGFDEPTGHGPAVEQQADDLTREMFPEPAQRGEEPADLQRAEVASPIEEDRVPIEEIRMPIDDTLPPDQIRAQVQRLTNENVAIVKDLIAKIDEKFGTESGDNIKDLSKVTQKANRPSILAKKPWHKVSHIRDSYRFKTVIDDIRDVPAIFDELLATGIQLVKVDTGKLFSPKEWGWRIIAFDLRMPNGQLVEWYLPIRELEAQKKAEGHLLFEEWRNKSPDEINLEMDAYMATIQRSFEGYDKAFQASLDRMGISREEAAASWARAESSMLEAARKSPSSSGMITSSGERVLDIQDPSSARIAQAPDGKNIITREVPSSIRAEEGVSIGAAPMFEFTTAGEQALIPGVEPITDIGLAQAGMQRPMRGGQEAPPEGGLFDDVARAQEGLFDQVDLDEEFPVGVAGKDADGNDIVETMTFRTMKDMLDEEDDFITRLGICST